jgi:hypothetical protein
MAEHEMWAQRWRPFLGEVHMSEQPVPLGLVGETIILRNADGPKDFETEPMIEQGPRSDG